MVAFVSLAFDDPTLSKHHPREEGDGGVVDGEDATQERQTGKGSFKRETSILFLKPREDAPRGLKLQWLFKL